MRQRSSRGRWHEHVVLLLQAGRACSKVHSFPSFNSTGRLPLQTRRERPERPLRKPVPSRSVLAGPARPGRAGPAAPRQANRTDARQPAAPRWRHFRCVTSRASPRPARHCGRPERGRRGKKMAAQGRGRVGGGKEERGSGRPESELLLHPELLSEEFLLLTLEQKNILVENDVKMDKDGLTDLYIQHAIPLPQRDLPKSRWGKMMEKKRQENELKSGNKSVGTVEGLRKRPLIVFDGNSTSTSIKVKKTENGAADRLKLPPAGSTTNTVRRLSIPSNASTYISASSLSEDAKLGVRNNEAKQNSISKTNSSVLASLKVYPLSPVAGTTVVKLKRAVPKEESDLPPQ
uniref:Ashwin n=1 Tax=Falco tinnunculus TaxID=100819 RepID=A0A8C4UVV6_FALTI